MVETNFTTEAINIFQYIKDTLIKEHPTNKITIEYFLLAVLKNEESTAYKILSRSTLTSTLESLRDWLSQSLLNVNTNISDDNVVYDTIYDRCIEYGKDTFGANPLSSGHMLLAVLKKNDTIAKHLKQIGITYEQLLTNINNMFPTENNDSNKTNQNTQMQQPQQQKGAVEDLLIDINKMAANGKVDEVIGNDEIIDDIFNVLSKRDRNNVVVVGDSGIGKTATVLHIANLLNNGKVPDAFKNKKLMKMDFMSLVSGAVLRGNFEAKFNAIVADAIKKNGYIFFIDDMQSILSDKSKFGEINTENMLDMILMERNIQFICTMDNRSYTTYIQSNPSMKRRFQKVQMYEKDNDTIVEILKKCKTKYEKFHNVEYTDDAIETCVNLTKRYVKEAKLPDYAIDVLDEAGARTTTKTHEDERITKYRLEIRKIQNELKLIDDSISKKDYDRYDELKKQEILIKSKITAIEKEELLNKKPSIVNEDDIREIISKKIKIPVTNLTTDDCKKLKTLAENLKKNVIGQDEAVDEVCRVVKRQRIGIANRNRPAVLFFAGMTGTGKTYLAKKLAQEVFGDEKSMVRIDMSEYSDKMSVTKLYGSAAGYVGYDKGGILTEAIKKNNHCVLLLDEMEKASEEVHNVFLQLFDDGRLTDNTGVTVDFSNVIVIMTSNVGAKEISSKGNNIGFIKANDGNNKEAITKAMKSKFTPEFINRIDKVIFFNKLTEENIKNIISLELSNLSERLTNMGYSLGESFMDSTYVSSIYNKVKEKSEYGARPILHVIRHEVEDKITDYIIDNQPDKGFVFQVTSLI